MKKQNQIKLTIFFTIFAIVFLSLINLTSAMIISDVVQGELTPGKTANLIIDVKNTLSENVEDVLLNLILEETPFISVGGSENSEDEIRKGRSESFSFTIKASPNTKAGNYMIPYVLTYTDLDNKKIEKKGSIGIIVSAETELTYDIVTENNIVGEQGKMILRINNKGLADVKFVDVVISGEGFTIIGSPNDYIGTVNSDDFESTSFNVIFNQKNVRAIATINYKDFENNPQTTTFGKEIKVYTLDEAYALGLKKKSYTSVYIWGIILLIVIWFVYRIIKKRIRKNNKKRESY